MGDSSATNGSNGTEATASLACPNCNYLNLAGFPAGVKFAPSDQELIEHLESMVLVKEGGGSRAHPLLNHFISTIEGGNDICYTHPENLPGVTKDGLSKHFFHKTSKAYPTGTRKRRKIQSERGQRSSEDAGEAHWHKTGRTHAVIVGGRQKGCKKILVLHNIKQGMREKTNWIMHQYHLGMSDDEKDGVLVLSKVFYRCPDATMVEVEHNNEKVEVTSEATSNILRVSGAAAVTAATVNMVQQQQHQPQRQAHGQDQCKFAPPNMFQEAGVGDLVSGDQGQVHDNNHHIPSQHLVQSVHMEPDTTLSLQVGVGDPVSGDQGQVHGNNHHIPSQHHVQSVDTEPVTTLSLAISAGWCK